MINQIAVSQFDQYTCVVFYLRKRFGLIFQGWFSHCALWRNNESPIIFRNNDTPTKNDLSFPITSLRPRFGIDDPPQKNVVKIAWYSKTNLAKQTHQQWGDTHFGWLSNQQIRSGHHKKNAIFVSGSVANQVVKLGIRLWNERISQNDRPWKK